MASGTKTRNRNRKGQESGLKQAEFPVASDPVTTAKSAPVVRRNAEEEDTGQQRTGSGFTVADAAAVEAARREEAEQAARDGEKAAAAADVAQAAAKTGDFLSLLAKHYGVKPNHFDSPALAPLKPALAQFTAGEPLPASKKEPLIATIETSVSGQTIKPIHIYYNQGKGGDRVVAESIDSLEQALRMAIAAKAGPNFEKGVTFTKETTDEEKALLAAAAAVVGLKIVDKDVKVDPQLKARCADLLPAILKGAPAPAAANESAAQADAPAREEAEKEEKAPVAAEAADTDPAASAPPQANPAPAPQPEAAVAQAEEPQQAGEPAGEPEAAAPEAAASAESEASQPAGWRNRLKTSLVALPGASWAANHLHRGAAAAPAETPVVVADEGPVAEDGQPPVEAAAVAEPETDIAGGPEEVLAEAEAQPAAAERKPLWARLFNRREASTPEAAAEAPVLDEIEIPTFIRRELEDVAVDEGPVAEDGAQSPVEASAEVETGAGAAEEVLAGDQPAATPEAGERKSLWTRFFGRQEASAPEAAAEPPAPAAEAAVLDEVEIPTFIRRTEPEAQAPVSEAAVAEEPAAEVLTSEPEAAAEEPAVAAAESRPVAVNGAGGFAEAAQPRELKAETQALLASKGISAEFYLAVEEKIVETVAQRMEAAREQHRKDTGAIHRKEVMKIFAEVTDAPRAGPLDPGRPELRRSVTAILQAMAEEGKAVETRGQSYKLANS